MSNLLGTLALGCLVGASAVCGELVLAEGGKTPFKIYVDDSATSPEKYAAQELSAYLGKITGATFPVAGGAVKELVNAKTKNAIVLIFDEALSSEEYELRTTTGTEAGATGALFISGGRPRGVLYGVYALLEDHLGCRWYTSEVEKIPHHSRLVLKDIAQRVKPRLEYREPFWTEAFNGDWAARNRMNSANARLEDKHGGKIVYGTFVHTFNSILNPEKEFAGHPDYFSLIKGKRTDKHTQLCLTNPEVLQIAIKTVKEWIAKNPKANIFSVSQNDWMNPCECPACKAIDDAEGSHAGTLIKFVNAVAEAIEKEHPNVAIDTLAYQYTRKPPTSVIPRPNVIVRLCSIECCFSHPLDGCPEKTNTSFMEDIRGWNKLTKRLYIWDYTTDFAHYVMPFPNLDSLDKNIRTFANNGVVGIFEQGAYSSGGCGELTELRSWVLAKLLWNPALDGEKLRREFIEGAYGPAAGHIQKFVDMEMESIKASGEHIRIFDGPNKKFLNTKFLRDSVAVLADARKIADDSKDEKLSARVRRVQMPIWYTIYAQNKEPFEVIRDCAQELVEGAKALKITHFHEWTDVKHDFKRMELYMNRKRIKPEVPGTLMGEDCCFRFHKEGDLVSMVPDPKSDDGVAARQVGRTLEWSVAWDLPVPDGPLAPKYTLRARIRIEKKGEAGPAFHVGVYDTVDKKGLGEIRVQAKDCDGEYHWYNVAEIDIKNGRYAYVAPDNNEANVTAIFTDRMELVPVK
ncbi:MAG TPA: DUF4838 domain-containing protein [Planctomycetota bacterium]|jgi:hypothetical protein